MHNKVQMFHCRDVEVTIWERKVGCILIGYLATFTFGGKFHRIYGHTSTLCWVLAVRKIREAR